jgi:hypothetical protein
VEDAGAVAAGSGGRGRTLKRSSIGEKWLHNHELCWHLYCAVLHFMAAALGSFCDVTHGTILQRICIL